MSLGEMGMTVFELEAISSRSLFNKLIGFRSAEKQVWERHRMQCYFAMQPIDPNDPDQKTLMEITDFMPFDWDEQLDKKSRWEEIKADAAEQKKKRDALWAKIDGKI